MWSDGGRGTTRRQQIEESAEGREEPVSPVWGGTAHCLPEVAWAESRRSRGRTVGNDRTLLLTADSLTVSGGAPDQRGGWEGQPAGVCSVSPLEPQQREWPDHRRSGS